MRIKVRALVAVIGWFSLLPAFSAVADNFVDGANFDGGFNVTLQCVESPGVSCTAPSRQLRAVVLNTDPLGGVIVTFHETQFGNLIYGFSNVSYSNDLVLQGTTQYNNVNAEFRIQFDSTLATITGWINDLQSGINYRVDGKRNLSFAQLFQGTAVQPLSWAQLGALTLQGTADALPTSVTFQQSIIGSGAGTWTAIQHLYGGGTVSYQAVELNTDTGTVKLTAKQSQFGFLRWVIQQGKTRTGSLVWTGSGISSNTGGAIALSFQ